MRVQLLRNCNFRSRCKSSRYLVRKYTNAQNDEDDGLAELRHEYELYKSGRWDSGYINNFEPSTPSTDESDKNTTSEKSLIPVDEEEEEKKKDMIAWERAAKGAVAKQQYIDFKKQVTDERKSIEATAEKVMKDPEWQFYTKVKLHRMHEAEAKFEAWREAQKKPPSVQYRQKVDKYLDDIIHATDQEFYDFYRARDERYFNFMEESMKRLEDGNPDPRFLSFVVERQKLLDRQDNEELDLILAPDDKFKNTLVGVPDDEYGFENNIDDDDIEFGESREEALHRKKKSEFLLLSKNKAKFSHNDQKQPEQLHDHQTRQLSEQPEQPEPSENSTQQEFPDDLQYSRYEKWRDRNKIYDKYEDISLYREELDNSEFAGYDRVMAHVKAREKLKEEKERQKQGLPHPLDEFDSMGKLVFMERAQRKKDLKAFLSLHEVDKSLYKVRPPDPRVPLNLQRQVYDETFELMTTGRRKLQPKVDLEKKYGEGAYRDLGVAIKEKKEEKMLARKRERRKANMLKKQRRP